MTSGLCTLTHIFTCTYTYTHTYTHMLRTGSVCFLKFVLRKWHKLTFPIVFQHTELRRMKRWELRIWQSIFSLSATFFFRTKLKELNYCFWVIHHENKDWSCPEWKKHLPIYSTTGPILPCKYQSFTLRDSF